MPSIRNSPSGQSGDFGTLCPKAPIAPSAFKQERELRKGDAHAPHDVHDLAVFRLQLFLLQLLEPGLLFTDFSLDLINLG